MKLRTKLLITLLSGVLLVSVASQVFQLLWNARLVRQLADQNLATVEQSEWRWVESLEHAVHTSLDDAMTQGDMDKFSSLLQAQKEVKGLQELSLYNMDGIATYSTATNRLRERLEDKLAAQILKSPEPYRERTPDSFVLYRPSPVTKGCLECHNEFKEGAIGGVIAMRVSTESLAKSQGQWQGLVGTLNRSTVSTLVWSTVAMCLVTALIIAQAVRKQISLPLNRISACLDTASIELGTASGAVANSSNQLAEGASHQAASLEETSSSLEEMASMTRGNADHAAKVDALAREAAGAAETGMQDMQALADAMEGIRTSGTEVAKIIRTIDEIAFQTNILALNAAVEAARAGEAGMGFAVVADEVRNLAQRSAQAAKETASRIDESIQRGNRGAELSGQVRAKLESILSQIRQVTALATEVAAACREQDQGVQQIAQAVGQMDRATQSSAASAEECASASEELKAQSTTLRDAIHDLLILVEGTASGAGQDSAPASGPLTQSAASGIPANGKTASRRPTPAHGPRTPPRSADVNTVCA